MDQHIDQITSWVAALAGDTQREIQAQLDLAVTSAKHKSWVDVYNSIRRAQKIIDQHPEFASSQAEVWAVHALVNLWRLLSTGHNEEIKIEMYKKIRQAIQREPENAQLNNVMTAISDLRKVYSWL